jgi:hypothetical protein
MAALAAAVLSGASPGFAAAPAATTGDQPYRVEGGAVDVQEAPDWLNSRTWRRAHRSCRMTRPGAIL